MIEVFLFGIVLGLIPITLAGLFVTAYFPSRRGDQLDLWFINVSFFVIPYLFSLILIDKDKIQTFFWMFNYFSVIIRRIILESRSVGFEPTTSGFGDPRSAELN